MENFDKTKTFEGGHSTSLTDNVERENTFQKGVNGRLYSKNGVLSFSAVKGSKLVYQNNKIVKYLGYFSFKDEVIVFAKCLKSIVGPGLETEVCDINIDADSFVIIDDVTAGTVISILSEITDNTLETEECYTITTPPNDNTVFDTQYSCTGTSELEIDFEEYYGTHLGVPGYKACSLNLNETPINNIDYYDCIISLKLDDDFNMVGTQLWVGSQNWPLNGKITAEGVEENEFYKRVYYTDAINPRRVVNVKDTSLVNRSADEFNQVLNNVLLQPEVREVLDGGQLKTMKVLYTYRIISQNGQLSEFSPASFFTDILVEDTAIKYRGGDASEVTGKYSRIECNIMNAEVTSEIECVALEFEALGPPTAIRNLGRKPASSVVEFKHFGNEEEFSDNVTFNDIIDFKNTWKYCNDFTSKKNKLIAGGLRNEPIPTSINSLSYLFPLHGWNEAGESHDCLMNPEPWNYRYIDPTNTDPLIYVKQKVYRSISSFGPLTLKFKNVSVPNEIEITFNALVLDNYTNIIDLVLAWLLDQKANNVNFDTYFPNLEISNETGQLLLSPTDDMIETDMSNYIFESNNSQFIENFDNDIVFLNPVVDTTKLVYGGQSIGFHQGNGIRVTYRQFSEPLLNQATAIYDGTGNLLDYEAPSLEKYCMKGEIYRIGLQAYNNDSTRYFAIPLGDLMIPNIGDLRKEIDNSGNVILSSSQYLSQSVQDGVLYGHGVKMHIEVRLDCELQKEIPMYQIVYVERTEDNRTILCQGVSAPLNRTQNKGSGTNSMMVDAINNKWNLPYCGGPTYEKTALKNYDLHGQNDQYSGDAGGDSYYRRTMTHRALMSFDSPDLYYNKISDQYLESSIVKIVGKLNTDHTPGTIMESGLPIIAASTEIYPKFSRKILEHQLEGDNHSDPLPRNADEDREFGTIETHFVNVSVYANFQFHNEEVLIDKSVTLKRGEIISGAAVDVDNALSNNAYHLPSMPWYYGAFQRDWETANNGNTKSEIFWAGVTSPGYQTAIIKTAEDLFTDSFIGSDIHVVNSEIRLGGYGYIVYDTIPLINIFRNNRESVFGGRSEEAFSNNVYIPLSRTIPTLKSSNGTQFFDVGADTYITLNIRTKNDFGDDILEERTMNNSGSARDKGDIKAWMRNGAWAYCAVLETQVEPKFTHQTEFYRESNTHNFDATRYDEINGCYFNENTLKLYVPQPFKFKDDPNRGHVIAVSDVKLAGDYFDAWTVFKVNNYYPLLEKNKGDISNFVRQDDIVFAIQEGQTSRVYIGEDRIITDKEGNAVTIQQGSGNVVDGHKVISDYGTGIRRAALELEGDYGFCFFDEKNVEFVKINKPLLTQNLLHTEYFNLFKTNPIIDTEPFFDFENKETNIRLRTKNGTSYTISYNEVMKVFNGLIEYDDDLYIMFDKKTYYPINTGSLSEDLHQLNEGEILNISGELRKMTLGFHINAKMDKVFQYKAWTAISGIDFPFESITFKSSLGQERVVLGTHNWYKIREGNHTVPAMNETNDPLECYDIRGNWVYVEMVVSIPKDKLDIEKVNILAVINSLRFSHQ